MSVLLTGMGFIAEVLGIWTAVSLVALVPLVLWFRSQAVTNDLQSRRERRGDWRVAAGPAASP